MRRSNECDEKLTAVGIRSRVSLTFQREEQVRNERGAVSEEKEEQTRKDRGAVSEREGRTGEKG